MENVDDIKLGLVKFRADSTKYFELFDKHIPRFENNGKGRKILMLGLSNESMMLKCCALNKNVEYFVADQAILSETLPLLGEEYCFNFFDSELDLLTSLKNCNIKFDCIIMNPPYKRTFFMKIFNEAVAHLNDAESKVISLNPIADQLLQDPMVNVEIVNMQYSSKLFDNNFHQQLGIFCADKEHSSAEIAA